MPTRRFAPNGAAFLASTVAPRGRSRQTVETSLYSSENTAPGPVPSGRVASSNASIPALDGVRGVAILLVLLFHLYPFVNWDAPALGGLRSLSAFGFSGVLLFFVLSGFLLFLPYARALVAGHPWPSARSFYRRRALRVLPVYSVAVAAMTVLLLAGGSMSPKTALSLGLVALLAHNMSVDAAKLVSDLDGPLWTLALEWQFYLVLPLFAVILRRLSSSPTSAGRARRILVALAVLAAAGLAIRIFAGLVFYRSGFAVPMAASGGAGLALRLLYGYYGRYVEVFALGMAVSVLYVAYEPRRQVHGRDLRVGVVAVMGFAVTFIACMWWNEASFPHGVRDLWAFDARGGWLWTIFGLWVTSVAFALLLTGVLAGPAGLRGVFAWRPLRFVGTVSYSVYIWHVPVFKLAREGVTALLITFVVALASYYFIEKPFLRRRYVQPGGWRPRNRDVSSAAT